TKKVMKENVMVPIKNRVSRDAPPAAAARTEIEIANMNFYYGKKQALFDINLEIPAGLVTAFIGPSGCGKSTLLRSINRMNDTIPNMSVRGTIKVTGQDIYAPSTDVVTLRKRVGMVFQKSNPFPRSIFDNVAYGLKINRLTKTKKELEGRV